jgi:hypothetical protein
MRWTPPRESARERRVADKLRAASRFYRFLWEVREELFADDFEEELIASYRPRGQDPCPPALLAMAMLLQRYDGLSDCDAVEAAEHDRRWQLVLGTLGQEKAPFGQGTLVRFRMRMMAHDLDKKLVDRTVELAKKSGKFGWKKLRIAIDSSPLQGAGRVEDTWNLIGRAMSKVVHAVSLALSMEEDDVIRRAGLTVLSADSIKSATRSAESSPRAGHATRGMGREESAEAVNGPAAEGRALAAAACRGTGHRTGSTARWPQDHRRRRAGPRDLARRSPDETRS